jgi:hypothetical protein
MTSVDDVLRLDNSRKSKIQRLLITCCASPEGAARSEHEIQVDFDGRTAGKIKVTVSVRSDNVSWSDRALSEVEEQVERTSLQDVPHRVALVVLVLSALTCLLFLLLPFSVGNSTFGNADVMWLRLNDVNRVEQILKQGRTITDDEMREIATRQLRNVIGDHRTNQPSEWTRQKAFVGVPLLTILACAVYLVRRCYPSAVFLWGDEIERYNNILQTRRIVWGIIIALAVGVLSKFLYTGLVAGP